MNSVRAACEVGPTRHAGGVACRRVTVRGRSNSGLIKSPSRFARTHQFRFFIHVSDGSEFKVVGMREIPQFRRDA